MTAVVLLAAACSLYLTGCVATALHIKSHPLQHVIPTPAADAMIYAGMVLGWPFALTFFRVLDFWLRV
jgi:hypothetical protein